MVDVADLYREAAGAKIPVYFAPMPRTRSMSLFLDGGQCVIGMDSSRVWTKNDEREHLAHELGHCLTGAFYTRYSPVDNRAKCEEMATRAEIERLFPFAELKLQVEKTAGAIWEIAEWFGVSESLVRRAYDYYKDACGFCFESEEG